jgi:hypothetical protein
MIIGPDGCGKSRVIDHIVSRCSMKLITTDDVNRMCSGDRSSLDIMEFLQSSIRLPTVLFLDDLCEVNTDLATVIRKLFGVQKSTQGQIQESGNKYLTVVVTLADDTYFNGTRSNRISWPRPMRMYEPSITDVDRCFGRGSYKRAGCGNLWNVVTSLGMANIDKAWSGKTGVRLRNKWHRDRNLNTKECIAPSLKNPMDNVYTNILKTNIDRPVPRNLEITVHANYICDSNTYTGANYVPNVACADTLAELDHGQFGGHIVTLANQMKLRRVCMYTLGGVQKKRKRTRPHVATVVDVEHLRMASGLCHDDDHNPRAANCVGHECLFRISTRLTAPKCGDSGCAMTNQWRGTVLGKFSAPYTGIANVVATHSPRGCTFIHTMGPDCARGTHEPIQTKVVVIDSVVTETQCSCASVCPRGICDTDADWQCNHIYALVCYLSDHSNRFRCREAPSKKWIRRYKKICTTTSMIGAGGISTPQVWECVQLVKNRRLLRKQGVCRALNGNTGAISILRETWASTTRGDPASRV